MSLSRLQLSLTRVVDGLYLPIFRKLIPLQTFRYGVCGSLNLVNDGLVYFLIYHFIVANRYLDLGVMVISPHISSFILTFPITFFVGFWLAKNISFQDQKSKTQGERRRYFLVVIINLIAKYLGLKLLIEIVLLPAAISNIAMTVITVVISYLLQRNFTFKAE